ncbi:MAG: NYN domain-containing protein [Acidobacteria bacterium]|nr:NYN domain-containing protein [Acidobacteriota bacterium]
MQLIWYLFIDGAYVRQRYSERMMEYFREEGELDFARLFSSAGAFKAFYYDCLDDCQKRDESTENFDRRVEQQTQFFESIQALPGYHVRLGSLSGAARKIRQKKVDVLLAVDVLTHAFQKNMTAACLIAGDLDFEPVVASLIHLGVYVRVMYDRKSIAPDLYRGACPAFS